MRQLDCFAHLPEGAAADEVAARPLPRRRGRLRGGPPRLLGLLAGPVRQRRAPAWTPEHTLMTADSVRYTSPSAWCYRFSQRIKMTDAVSARLLCVLRSSTTSEWMA